MCRPARWPAAAHLNVLLRPLWSFNEDAMPHIHLLYGCCLKTLRLSTIIGVSALLIMAVPGCVDALDSGDTPSRPSIGGDSPSPTDTPAPIFEWQEFPPTATTPSSIRSPETT